MQATLILPGYDPIVLNLPDYVHNALIAVPPAQRPDVVTEVLADGLMTGTRAPRESPEAAAVLMEVLRTGKDKA